ncbi:MAG: Gldg family protein [Candidatus Omnitrophica bacterium]|nr:Gldg family protein [Candidatus Omnitrophota bacterium]
MEGFSRLWTICKRELAAYFNSAIAYIFIIVFVLLNAGLFMTQFFIISRADMRPFFATFPFVLAVFIPAVTMRLWAEEKRGNTLELLLTFPMATHELVLGKFIAGFIFYLTALAATLPIPVMIQIMGNPDMGTILGGYLGTAFMGAFFLAVGIFISGLCRDQIVAFILSMLICFGFHLFGTDFLASSIDGWIPGFGSLLQQYIGTTGHFASFGKGVIDNRDILYFVVGTVLFLVLNGFWLEGRMRPGAKKIFTTATIICAGIFLMTNWLFAGMPIGRFDLTEGKIYTISPATVKIMRELKAPVTAKFYVSPQDKMPTGMKTLEQDVIDKLDELRIAAKGNFDYKIFHMEAANVTGGAEGGGESLEEKLQAKGIQPFQVQAVVSDEVAVRLIYASLSLSYKEKPEEIIPRVMPGNLFELEYLLASKIYRMTLPEIPKIALVAPYEDKELDPQIQALIAQLGAQAPSEIREDEYELLGMALDYDGYPVERVTLTEEEPIPEGTKTLAIVEPRNLNDRQRYEINKFLVGGGSLFLAVQNYTYRYSPKGNVLDIYSEEVSPGINVLLKEWGFGVDENILVDEQHDVVNLSGGANLGPFSMSVPVKIPIQVLIPQSGMNPDVSITSRLSSLFYLWGTAITIDRDKADEQQLNIVKLLESSKDSWTVPFQTPTLSPADLEKQPESQLGPLPLAVMVSGQFKNAFKGKNVPRWPKKEDEEMGTTDEEGSASEEPLPPEGLDLAAGKMILMGSATMFQKSLVRGGGHLNFFLNAINAITLGEDLVKIRSKQPIDRSIGRVSTAAKVGWRLFVTLLVPLMIAVIGGFRMLMRRRSKSTYLKALMLSDS